MSLIARYEKSAWELGTCNGKYHSLTGTGRPVNEAFRRRLVTRCDRAETETSEGNATMKRITITALALALLCCCGCGRAAAQPTADTFASVADVPHKVDASIRCVGQLEADEPADAVEQEYAEYWEADYYEPSYSYSGDGFEQAGVREYEGRTETWYSSSTLYHYRTGEWTVDDEGYYRDDQGRYVVAASDVPEGTEIETSKGVGIVLDSGCDDGVTDFYVNF